MRKRVLGAVASVGLCTLPQAAGASGDYGCTVRWTLASPSYDCANRAVLSPGNDTRVNLALLLRDKAGLSTPGGRGYAATDYASAGFGRVFLDWDLLQASYWPSSGEESGYAYGGRRCDSLSGGDQAFASALLAARKVPESDRVLLSQSRGVLAMTCGTKEAATGWPEGVSSPIGSTFLAYVKGADAFYAGRFDEARETFQALRKSSDPWVSETAAYMIARNELVAAQSTAFDEWGWYLGSEATDKDAARRGQAALAAYLKQYPQGRYAASARGLQRRALWLLGDREALGRVYSILLTEVQAADGAVPELIEEVDDKVLFARGMTGNLDTPLLLATWDLQRMRAENEFYDGAREPITAEEIAAHEAVLSEVPGLFAFVQANHAFYVEQDYRKVLELLPGERREAGYAPLAFSRQVLRGMTLDALGDPDAGAFWLGLFDGAKDLYQRPAVELALAMHWEREDALARIFAEGSPVRESEIRMQLLEHSAGAPLLREQAQRADRPSRERRLAQFMLLYRELASGHYGAFLSDLKLVAADAPAESYIGGWFDPEAVDAPAGLFVRGKWSQDYPCPALAKTAAALSRNPGDSAALLCLGDFYRLNGFDDFMSGGGEPAPDELGGAADEFEGEIATRQSLYQRVIADPHAPASDKAYALYRAVWCYGPSGNNSCGGEDVPVEQRKAWFQRLKRDYPASRWAKDLKYYW